MLSMVIGSFFFAVNHFVLSVREINKLENQSVKYLCLINIKKD